MVVMKRVLITGANGFVGSSLAEHLCRKKEYNILLTSRSSNTSSLDLPFIQKDLLDKNLDDLFDDIHTVIHCAAQTGLSANEALFEQNNFQATKNLINACLKHRVKRFIFLSSPSIYLTPEPQAKIKEKDIPTKMQTAYAVSKINCELYLEAVQSFFETAIILRPATLYGPGAEHLAGIITEARSKKTVFQFNGNPTQISMTYIDNFVHALDTILKDETPRHDTFNIADNEGICMANEFLENYYADHKIAYRKHVLPFKPFFNLSKGIQTFYKIFRIDKPPFLTPYHVCNLGRNRILDTQHFVDCFPYQQQVSKHEGMHRFKAWIQANEEEL